MFNFRNKSLVVVAPHCDDEVLGVGGVLAKYAEAGWHTSVIYVTKPSPHLASEERWAVIKEEATRSCEILGVENEFYLDYRVLELNSVPSYELNARINALFVKLSPSIIFSPSELDPHEDHKRVFNAVNVASRPVNGFQPNLICTYETLSETEWGWNENKGSFSPNFFVDITETLDKKVQAMECFDTQLGTFPHPRSGEAITALARLRGSNIGVRAAEAFNIMRFVAP